MNDFQGYEQEQTHNSTTKNNKNTHEWMNDFPGYQQEQTHNSTVVRNCSQDLFYARRKQQKIHT